ALTKAAAPAPKPHQVRFDITQNGAIALARGDFRARIPKRLHHTAAAPAAQHRSTLELGEASKPPDADDPYGFSPIKGDQMRGAGEIVAVELLIVRTILFAHIDDGAKRVRCEQLRRRAHHLDFVARAHAASFVIKPIKGLLRAS